MPRSVLKYLSLPVLLLLATSSAQAITIGGNTYDEVLSFDIQNDVPKKSRHIGYWRDSRKFYTYAPTGINLNAANLPGTDGSAFDSFRLAGMTTNATLQTALASATFNFFADDGSALLTGSYLANGQLGIAQGTGANGRFDVTGLFTVTGGSLQDLFSSVIYVEFLFDYFGRSGTKDYYGKLGQVLVYGSNSGAPPNSEIPEPASLVLLASGLLAFKRRSQLSVTSR